MTQSMDQNDIVQLVAKILVENLRGADVPAIEPPMSIAAFRKSEGTPFFTPSSVKGWRRSLAKSLCPVSQE
jgi:hypothetical protein